MKMVGKEKKLPKTTRLYAIVNTETGDYIGTFDTLKEAKEFPKLEGESYAKLNVKSWEWAK